jgi:hypothetical protein
VDFLALFADQERLGFPDLAGSDGQGSIEVSERLLNTILTQLVGESTAIRELHVSPRAGNLFAVRLSLVKPSFLPALSFDIVVDKQPSLPDDPVLGLTLSGMGGLQRFAGHFAGFMKKLPSGVEMEGNRVLVDLRAVLAPHGLTSVLNYVKDVAIGAREGRLVLVFAVGVPAIVADVPAVYEPGRE